MELNLEVVLSSSIKRKKPWPRFCWLGKDKESVFLLDDNRISEINMVSGRTKRKTPKLYPLLNSVVTMAASHNGMWLCGLLVSGELFLWNRDKDLLKTAAGVPEVVHLITTIQEMHRKGSAKRLSIQVSGDGMRALLVDVTGNVFLWECLDIRDLMGIRDGTVKGQWAHILPLEDSLLPSLQDKEVFQHTIFVKTEVMGDACLSAFVFTSSKKLIITCLKIQWEEGLVSIGSMKYRIKWATKAYLMSHLTPVCQPVKSRGALVTAFSPDGLLLAIVLNQRQPKATQVLFVSTQNFVSISSGLGGCGSKKMDIPSKYIRSYWVGSLSWSPCGLFLSCVLKRGSLLMVSRLGGLLALTSRGSSVNFGPAHFLPLHPLVTYWKPTSVGKDEVSLSSSTMSALDVLRQQYSVTWHPRLLYLIVSDGYVATVMRVHHGPSPALMLATLLKDISKDLEKTNQRLDKSQVIHVKAWLDSVPCLNLDSSLEIFNPIIKNGPQTDSVLSTNTDGSTLPLFLQDQETLGGTKELLQKVQTFFEDESDLDGAPAGSHLEDHGRLEFASMFDTLHALDTQTDSGLVTSPDYERDSIDAERKSFSPREFGKIQSKLLAAWAFGMSLGNIVENRTLLLKHILYCVVRFVALLHLMPSSMAHTGKKNTRGSTLLLRLIKALLSFLSWDSTHSDGPHCLGLLIDFCKLLIRLLLTPHPESNQTGHGQSYHNLSTALLILQQISNALDSTYSLHQRTMWSSVETESKPPQLWSSDVHSVPFLHDEKEDKCSFVQQAQPVPQRPSSRMLGVWQSVYKLTLQCMEELKSLKGCDGWEEDHHQLSFIMSKIQTALQATGERLEQGPAVLSYPGEHRFLCGSYPESADTWRSQISELNTKSGDRSVFKETQLCLALLYSLLSQYHLREAQEFGDHMAYLILHKTGHHKNNITSKTEDPLPCQWLPVDLHSDAAYAVVQSLGRFMASYFTNQHLYILPPHHIAILPPLHLPRAPSVGRMVPLNQEEVSRALRQQQLSELWTVDYAQDLLLLGGLLPETVWLAYHLGDWKTAASLSLAYTNYCTDHFDFTHLGKRELHLPAVINPESIFQVELECLLSNKSDTEECRDKDGVLSFAESLEGEDWDAFQASIQEILKASVMVGVDVLSSTLSSWLDTAKDLCSYLPSLVPKELYLPSPPLYCPQPFPNEQGPSETGQAAEVASRHKVSAVLQRLLLLLRSARCCHPAAQWYISHLCLARRVLHKIKKKYSYPSATEEERAFPEGLIKFVNRSGFFRLGPKKDGHLDPDTIQTIICFRELCGLCWMLHVRDQLSISCRKYQAARQYCRDGKIPAESEIISACVGALCWVRRFLPFSLFLNAEETLQDLLLSLLSELPPLSLVADTLVQAFPEEEESVRVPLREKYCSLLLRLRQCNVLEVEKEEAGEPMMVVIQDRLRQRTKHLQRLQRHLATPELHLWRKEEKEEDRGSKHGMAMLRQLSLGTSLSNSTLTECGFPSVCSNGDTVDDTSEIVSPVMHNRDICRIKKAKHLRRHGQKSAVKIDKVIRKESHPGDAKVNQQPSLPVVGTWEFELEDEEYLNFLELFLTYVLEREIADGGNSGCELPLLKDFSSQLRERELHSLTFDVRSTIHRQRDAHHPLRKHTGTVPPVFRAGSCYKLAKQGVTPELQTTSIWSEAPILRTSSSVSLIPGLRTGKQRGLFGLRQQISVPLGQKINGSLFGSETSPIQSGFHMGHPPESFIFGSSTSVKAVTELQQGLDPKLEAQFPELSRLLEWMVRWANSRVLHWHHVKKKKGKGGLFRGTANESVMIRVKASAPAILTSLSLLQRRYTSALGTDRYRAHIQVPAIQCTVAPVVQVQVGRPMEKGNDGNISSPTPANRPNSGLDYNLQQQELSISSSTDETEEMQSLRTPPPHDQDQLAFQAQQAQYSSQQSSRDDMDVTPEKEETNGASVGLEASASVSNENTFGNICPDEMSLKLSDLDLSENVEDASNSVLLHTQSSQAPPPSEPEGLSTVDAEVEVPAELSCSAEATLPKTPMDSPNPQPQNPLAGAPAADFTEPHQPLSNQSPPMRQRLGEDLFRLVQNINYMSLREVLGASFSNLQLAQQSSSFVQSNKDSSHPNAPSSYATNFIPELHAIPVQTNSSLACRAEACMSRSGSSHPQVNEVSASMFAEQPARKCSDRSPPTSIQHHPLRTLSSTSNVAGVNNQEMQPLSVQAVSPKIQFKESRGLIPSSQGLLAMTDSSHRAPVLPPSNSCVQGDLASYVLGLKLLQLQHPPSTHKTAPHYPPALMLHTANRAHTEPHQLKFKSNDQFLTKKTDAGKKNVSPGPKTQLSFPCNPSQPNTQTSEKFKGQQLPLLLTATPMQSLYQLHLDPAPQRNITFPKLPVPSSSRPKMTMPAAAPTVQMIHLISMEEVTGSVRQSAEEAQRQLLTVDPPAESERRHIASQSSKTSKRQRKREKRARRQRKNKEPIKEHVNEDHAVAEMITPAKVVPIPSEVPVPFDSFLTGQRLLDQVTSTSAELHAFASTSKRLPEFHFTNTDPVCPPLLVDKAVSASVTAGNQKSQRSEKPHLCFEGLIQDTEKTPGEPERNLDRPGRQFISITDLEVQDFHDDLPIITTTPAVPDVPLIQPSSPTSAQLHVLATSVFRSAATADVKPIVAIAEDLPKPTTHTDISEESPSLDYIETNRNPERITLQDLEDPSASEICRAIKTQSVRPHSASSTHPTVWFSSHLSQLDAQLAVLESIADNLEKDFSSSRMLVNNIERITPISAPDMTTTSPVKKTVRLSVPQKAWIPQQKIFEEEEGEENQGETSELYKDSGRKPSFYFASSSLGQRTGPSYLHAPLNTRDHPDETFEITPVLTDENLDQLELSDTAEILDDLVKGGYLSPTDLDLSNSHHKWVERRESSWMSPGHVLAEEESGELMTWMKRKQRERLDVYRKHRQRLREMERKPFSVSAKVKPKNPNRASNWRTRGEKEKFMLLEQYKQRTRDACSLVADPPNIPLTQFNSQTGGSPVASMSRSASAPPPSGIYRAHNVAASEKRSFISEQAHIHHSQWSADAVEWSSEDRHRRLGLDRPVTSLPKDRLSQVTRRGMVSGTKNNTKLDTATQSEEQHVGNQRETGLNKTPSGGTAAQKWIVREKSRIQEGEEVNVSEPFLELNSLRDPEDFNIVIARLRDEQEEGAIADVSDMDWVETSSINLSNIDWAAIESLVNDEEDEVI